MEQRRMSANISDFIGVNDVLQYVMDMKYFYDEFLIKTPLQLYEYFLSSEESYIFKKKVCFASRVHMLYPQNFLHEADQLSCMFNDKFSSMRSFLRCPYCKSCFSIEESYQIHMLKKSVICSVKECGNIVTSEALSIASLVKLYNDDRLGRISSFSSTLEFHASRNTWETFDTYVSQLVQKEAAASPRRASLSLHMRRQFSTIKKIACITLSPIFSSDLVHGMHRHWAFIVAVCKNFEYWQDEAVLAASIDRYRRFLQLKKEQLPPPQSDSDCDPETARPESEGDGDNEALVPTVDIELVWQAHMSQPKKYDRYCRVLTTGRRIRHSYRSPWYDTALGNAVDLREAAVVKKIYFKTCQLWSQRFHESYANLPPDRQRPFPLRLAKLLWSKLWKFIIRRRRDKKMMKDDEQRSLAAADVDSTVVVIGWPVHTAMLAWADDHVNVNPTAYTSPPSLDTLVTLTSCPSSPPPTAACCETADDTSVSAMATAPCTPANDDNDNDNEDNDVVRGDQIEIHLQGRLIDDDSDRWRY